MKSIHYIILFATLLLMNISVLAQKRDATDLFRLPPNLAFLLSSNRSDSPIRVEFTDLYTTKAANRVTCKYKIQNVGQKNIRRISFKIITNFLFHPEGGGRLEIYEDAFDFGDLTGRPFFAPKSYLWSRDVAALNDNLLPDAVISQIVSQASNVKAKFVVAVVVNRIDFEDGSMYDATSDAIDLQKLFSQGLEAR